MTLIALQYHHITTCIPNPLTWFAHFHSPAWVSKVGTYVTFFTELFLPMWLVAYPSRFTRIFVGTVSIFFQLGIQATGNLIFFIDLLFEETMPTSTCLPLCCACLSLMTPFFRVSCQIGPFLPSYYIATPANCQKTQVLVHTKYSPSSTFVCFWHLQP